jgi:Flp pilus assembly pilin Flp
MLTSLSRLLQDRRGVTALEYGVIAGVIVFALGFAFAPLGEELAVHYYHRVTSTIASASSGG